MAKDCKPSKKFVLYSICNLFYPGVISMLDCNIDVSESSKCRCK
jgi:hypothetical protein